MKKSSNEKKSKDIESLVDTLGLGLSYKSGFGLSQPPNQLVSVMDTEPFNLEGGETRK